MSYTDYITQAGILERGWTKGLIKRFLGEPDKLKPNPHYKKAGMMRLYGLERIKTAEKEKGFKEAQVKAKARGAKTSARMKAKYEQLSKELTEQAKAFEVEIEVYRKRDVFEAAIDHYNFMQMDRGRSSELCASKYSSKKFLKRIQVNFIRHNLTNYEYLLACLAEPLGANKAKWSKTAGEAAHIVMVKTLDVIAEHYPYLRKECMRQKKL